jgi:hypothetical protein
LKKAGAPSHAAFAWSARDELAMIMIIIKVLRRLNIGYPVATMLGLALLYVGDFKPSSWY